MRSYWLLISSIFTALLASLCCLGAMSYMLFGIAIGFLNALEVPIWIRVIFAILSISFLLLAFRAIFKKTCSKSPFKALSYITVTIFVLGVILFPYIMGYLYE